MSYSKDQRATTSSGNSTTTFPSEWLPVIERDIEKQKTETNTRTAFSDAYLSGMPAKKRKLLVSANPLATAASTSNQEDNEPSRLMLSRVLSRTLDKCELKSGASRDELEKASLGQSELVNAFGHEFDAAINERLRTDEDFLNILKTTDNSSSEATTDTTEKSGDLVYNKNRFPLIRKHFK